MAEEVMLRGKVDATGRLILEQEIVNLEPGTVEVIVRRKTSSGTLDEVKQRLANPPVLTLEQRKRVEELYDQHEKIAEDLDLPPDFIDNLDNYLYGKDNFDKED